MTATDSAYGGVGVGVGVGVGGVNDNFYYHPPPQQQPQQYPQPQQLYPNLQPMQSYYPDPQAAASQQPQQPVTGDYYRNNFQLPPGTANMMNDQMANLAMAYGQTLVGQGKQMVDQKLEKFVPISKLKYYFAVDTTYVRRKLTLLLFPFTNTDWSMKYSQEQEPVAPRYETNAPDLYIPVMAFVTFLLVAGISQGVQNKFSPEQLGILSSSTFGWLILEVLILLITTYIMNITTDLSYLDIIAFCSYKYVGMIAVVCGSLLFHSTGYYLALIYSSLALCYFLAKTLRIQVSSKGHDAHVGHGNKRRMYFILCVCGFQPLLMFWLTRHLMYLPQSTLTTGSAAIN
ncbi:Protein yif1b [Chamberlinius hualienensis]